MSYQSLLEQAIREQRIISFNYLKPGKEQGIRVGNPHALYVSKKGEILCDVYQTSGATDEYDLPSWRQFTIDNLGNVNFTDRVFSVASGYNTYSSRYSNCIVRI